MDAFQDAVIALFNNFSAGKSLQETTTLKTYLFAIGMNKLIDLAGKQSKMVTFSGDWEINSQNGLEMATEASGEFEREEENKEMVRKYLEQLDGNCRKVLELYYLQGMKMEEIAKELGYKNANVAKKKKSLCLKKLSDLVRMGLAIFLF